MNIMKTRNGIGPRLVGASKQPLEMSVMVKTWRWLAPCTAPAW